MTLFEAMALKEIVLFRHAKKATNSADPDLSQEGLKQAQSLVAIVKKNSLPLPQQLLSSPRRRAQQTLMQLQEEFQIPLVLEPALDERSPHETRMAFKSRINHFLFKDLPSKSKECVFLCTHLDWFEIFAEISPLDIDITSDILHLPPASYYHIAVHPQDPSLPWTLVQKGQVLS